MLPIDVNKTIDKMKAKTNEGKKAIDYRHSIQGTANQLVGENLMGMNPNGNQMQSQGEVYAQ